MKAGHISRGCDPPYLSVALIEVLSSLPGYLGYPGLLSGRPILGIICTCKSARCKAVRAGICRMCCRSLFSKAFHSNRYVWRRLPVLKRHKGLLIKQCKCSSGPLQEWKTVIRVLKCLSDLINKLLGNLQQKALQLKRIDLDIRAQAALLAGQG